MPKKTPDPKERSFRISYAIVAVLAVIAGVFSILTRDWLHVLICFFMAAFFALSAKGINPLGGMKNTRKAITEIKKRKRKR